VLTHPLLGTAERRDSSLMTQENKPEMPFWKLVGLCIFFGLILGAIILYFFDR
jgi:hypothetical protein